MKNRLHWLHATPLALPVLLAACGGSDSGSTPPPPPPAANIAPTIASGSTAKVVENNATAYRIDGRDQNGDSLTYSVSGGADASLFSITGSDLVFKAAPNYERPRDANLDNIYVVEVSVSDGRETARKTVEITVTNDKEGIAVTRVATGFNQPTFVTPVPGSNRLFVSEKGGRIYSVDMSGVKTLATTVTDISTAGEGGLLGMAPTPDFANFSGMIVFAVAQNGDIELRTIYATGGTSRDGVTNYAIPHPTYTNHYGGWMTFGPDGNLYVATGDGGGAGDPEGNAQNPQSKLGKILRFRYDADPYAGASVPRNFQLSPAVGNPYTVRSGGDPTVYALGLRNPFRATFDGNNLLIGDVGQDKVEEIDWLSTTDGALTNFGWPVREGTLPYQGSTTSMLTNPVLQYRHGSGWFEGNSIIMGVRASGYPGLKYLFADFANGNIWNYSGDFVSGTTLDMNNVENRSDDFQPEVGTIDNPVAFTVGGDGLVYILDFDGELFRVGKAN
nr:PQQ-dependent sugar dehydrogenase [Novosphingopyxis sp. YJ-S2-01]